jgi:hypothetical protein
VGTRKEPAFIRKAGSNLSLALAAESKENVVLEIT